MDHFSLEILNDYQPILFGAIQERVNIKARMEIMNEPALRGLLGCH